MASRLLATGLAIAALILGSCGRHTDGRHGASRLLPVPSHGPVRLGPYEFELPPWWNDVRVEVPDRLSDPVEFEEWQHEVMGRDSGSDRRRVDWREDVKAYVVAGASLPRDEEFPVFLGHFLFVSDQWSDAARVYGDLQQLADTQGGQATWYRVYLAHEAGRAALFAGDNDLARTWFDRAARFVGHADHAIAYYAAQSLESRRELSVDETPPPGTADATSFSADAFDSLPLTDRWVTVVGGDVEMRPLRGSRAEPTATAAESRLVLPRGTYRFVTDVVSLPVADVATLARTWAREQGGVPDVFTDSVEGAANAVVVTLSNPSGFETVRAAGAVFVASPDHVWRIVYRIDGSPAQEHRRCEDLVRRLARHVRLVSSRADGGRR